MGELYRLEQLSDFFFLLMQRGESLEDCWLRKRLKKESTVVDVLLDLIEKLDEMGYEDGVSFAFQSKRFDMVKGSTLSLIEIRRLGKTWRVIAYWDRAQKRFVLLDAFEAHRHKSMSEMVRQVKPKVIIAKALLREGGVAWQ